MEAKSQQGDIDADAVAAADGVTIDRPDEASAAADGELTVEAPVGDRPSRVLSGEPCDQCGAELSTIRINVDGRALLMESCDGCDVRRWQLAGERIDLQEALNQVGEHAGRRR